MHVAENRRRVQAHMGRAPLWLNQVHGVAVATDSPVLTQRHQDAVDAPPHAMDSGHDTGVGGAGSIREAARVMSPDGALLCADATVTMGTKQACAVLSADCLPILFCHRQRRVVAAAHAGWRGMAAGIIEATLKAMQADPAQVLMWLGPAIGPQAFEVGDEVRAAFVQCGAGAADAFRAGVPGKWWADLPRLARLRAQAAGVREIFGGEWCTVQDSQRFFSWRRDAGVTGRMGHFIWLEA